MRAGARRPGSVLRRDLDAVPIRIEHHTFVVPVAGAPRSVQDGETVRLEPLGQRVNPLFGAEREGDMGQPHPLGTRLDGHRGETGRPHDLDARPLREAEETGFEPLLRVHVGRTGHRAEVGGVEVLAPFDVICPQGNVFYAHDVSPHRSDWSLPGHALRRVIEEGLLRNALALPALVRKLELLAGLGVGILFDSRDEALQCLRGWHGHTMIGSGYSAA